MEILFVQTVDIKIFHTHYDLLINKFLLFKPNFPYILVSLNVNNGGV